MKSYPIDIGFHPYGGRDPPKVAKQQEYNRLARRIETWLNDQLAVRPDGVYGFLNHEIARALGEDRDAVADVVFSIDCGHNGVTLIKRPGDPSER